MQLEGGFLFDLGAVGKLRIVRTGRVGGFHFGVGAVGKSRIARTLHVGGFPSGVGDVWSSRIARTRRAGSFFIVEGVVGRPTNHKEVDDVSPVDILSSKKGDMESMPDTFESPICCSTEIAICLEIMPFFQFMLKK